MALTGQCECHMQKHMYSQQCSCHKAALLHVLILVPTYLIVLAGCLLRLKEMHLLMIHRCQREHRSAYSVHQPPLVWALPLPARRTTQLWPMQLWQSQIGEHLLHVCVLHPTCWMQVKSAPDRQEGYEATLSKRVWLMQTCAGLQQCNKLSLHSENVPMC